MPALANKRHEAFALAVASGMGGTAAFRKVSGRARSGDSVMANKWLRLVKNRVEELQRATETANTLTMQERREFIARLIRTPIAQIDEHDPLCQSVKYVENERGSSREYRVADKVSALMDDAKLAGELVEKVEQTVDEKRVLPADRRAELLRASMARRLTHGRS